MPRAVPQNVLLVDDDPGAIQLMGCILTDVGTLRFATNGRDALRLAREFAPDLILLDAEMPGISGFRLLEMLKIEPDLADVPVIFITSHTEAGFEVSALEMGAADFIAKPFRSSLVLARVKTHLRMKRMADELRRAATTDAMTGVANRRLFDESLAREWLRGRRTGDALSLLLIDVDHFKLYNDRYGHQRGDDCLRQVAQALLSACHRPADLVARYGGEEFMLMLPQTPVQGAQRVAESVLAAVRALGIPHEGLEEQGPAAAGNRNVSVSVGIACHDDSSICRATSHATCKPGALVLAADQALYAAKRAGRDRHMTRAITDLCDEQTVPALPIVPGSGDSSPAIEDTLIA